MNASAPASLNAADCLLPLFHELAIALHQLSQWAHRATVEDADTPTDFAAMAALLAQTEAAFAMAGVQSLAAITSLSHRLVSRQSENNAPFPAELAATLSQTFSILTEAMERLLRSKSVPASNFLSCWAELAAWDLTGNAHPSAMLSLHVDDRLLPSVAAPEEKKSC